MADPITVETPSGPHVVAKRTVEWLLEAIVARDDLPDTYAVLSGALASGRVEFPASELTRFCVELKAVLDKLSPSEMSSLQTMESSSLSQALCS
jgi:hypothetical protein